MTISLKGITDPATVNTLRSIIRELDNSKLQVNRLKAQLSSATSGTSGIGRRTIKDDGVTESDRDNLNFVSPLTVSDNAVDTLSFGLAEGDVDHGGLGGLSDDDHPQYVLVAGDTMTGNLAFSAGTLTVAGIQNQNLVDKTAAETISGTRTHTAAVTIDDAGGSLKIDTDTGHTFTIADVPATGNINVSRTGTGSFTFSMDVTSTGAFITSDKFQDTSLTSKTILGTNVSGTIVEGTPGINDLSDVTITSPSADELLKYNGAAWVNANADLDELGDVSLTAAVDGDILMHNGSNWVDATTLTGNYTFSGTGTAITVTNDVDIDGVMSVGSGGVSPDSDTAINARFDMTGAPSASQSCLTFFAADSASSTTQTLFAIKGNVQFTGSRANKRASVFQVTQQVQNGATGSVNRMRLFDTDQVGGSTSTLAVSEMTGWRARNDYEDLAVSNFRLIDWIPLVDGGSVSTLRGFHAEQPTFDGAGSITNSYVIDIEDFSNATNQSAIRIAAASAATGATKQNINFLGGNWNTGHIEMENGHLWNDATHNGLRSNGAAPSDETDGMLLWGSYSVTVTGTSHTAGEESVILVDDDTAGSDVTVTLPAVASNLDKIYIVKKLGTTANVIIDGNGAETIDGAATQTISVQYDALMIVCNATEWWII